MQLYSFSPIRNERELIKAATYTHTACYKLCKQSLGKYLPNAGNMGIFCHYEAEYLSLTKLRKRLTEPSDDVNQKYYRLYRPIVVKAKGGIPGATYTHLYIRRPDPYRHQVGDVDFFLPEGAYARLKSSLLNGRAIKGARILERSDLDMVELYDPDVDALGYVSTARMTKHVRVKRSNFTKL